MSAPIDESALDALIDQQLCDAATILAAAKDQALKGDYDGARQELARVREGHDCPVCQAVVEEVEGTLMQLAGCLDSCDQVREQFVAKSDWAQQAFCPPPEESETCPHSES